MRRNPHHPEALLTQELSVGVPVVFRRTADDFYGVCYVASEPYLDRERRMITLVDEAGNRSEHSLVALGAEPDSVGMWSKGTFLTRTQ